MPFRGLVIGLTIVAPFWIWLFVMLGHPTSVWFWCDMLRLCN